MISKKIYTTSFILLLSILFLSCDAADSLSGNKNNKMGDNKEMTEMMGTCAGLIMNRWRWREGTPECAMNRWRWR